MANENHRGLAALSGVGLFLSMFVLAYLNATTANVLWSFMYVAGVAVTALASASKFAIALGVANRALHAADAVASVVPWVATFFVALQALRFHHDGLDGFMAGVAIGALVFLVCFGVTDSISAWFGKKYAALRDAAEEAAKRIDDIADAAQGKKH